MEFSSSSSEDEVENARMNGKVGGARAGRGRPSPGASPEPSAGRRRQDDAEQCGEESEGQKTPVRRSRRRGSSAVQYEEVDEDDLPQEEEQQQQEEEEEQDRLGFLSEVALQTGRPLHRRQQVAQPARRLTSPPLALLHLQRAP